MSIDPSKYAVDLNAEKSKKESASNEFHLVDVQESRKDIVHPNTVIEGEISKEFDFHEQRGSEERYREQNAGPERQISDDEGARENGLGFQEPGFEDVLPRAESNSNNDKPDPEHAGLFKQNDLQPFLHNTEQPLPEFEPQSGAALQEADENPSFDWFAGEPALETQNAAPTDIHIIGGAVDENAVNGTWVADLEASDPDDTHGFTYSLTDDADGRFVLVDNKLYVADGAAIDHETSDSHAILVEVTDAHGNTFSKILTLAVNDMIDNTLVGTNGRDRLVGSSEDDAIHGLNGNDRLYGNAGEDMIYGDGGHDRLYGGDDDDGLFGGTGNDRLYGQNGNDLMDGGEGNDRLYGGVGDDILTGGAGSDRLYGQAGADQLMGGDGNDYLYFDGDDTRVDGGAGYDYAIALGNQDVTLDMAASFIERARGANGNDVLDGSGLTAAALIQGGNGHDTILGGSGNDRLYGQNGNDLVDGGAGNDRLYGQNGDDRLMGGVGNDRLYGGSGGDDLQGGDGNDRLYGGSGDDVLAGGAGSDRLYGQAGADQLMGGDGNDYLYFDGDDTRIDGGAGYDYAIAQGNQDVTLDMAASSIERARGANGDDLLDGSGLTAAALIQGGNGHDTILGGSGGDRLYGQNGNDIIDGGAGNDRLYGQNGDDQISGGAGSDRLYGQNGDDQLGGGAGNDWFYGGQGNDSFIFQEGDGNDRAYGGRGAWTDSVQLADAAGGNNIGTLGVDWTLTLTQGTATVNADSIDLSQDADGVITLQDGSELRFFDIEEIKW